MKADNIKPETEKSSRLFLCWIPEELCCNFSFIFITCKIALRLWNAEVAEMIITLQEGLFSEQLALSLWIFPVPSL